MQQFFALFSHGVGDLQSQVVDSLAARYPNNTGPVLASAFFPYEVSVMIRFVLVLLGAAFGISAVIGYAQEARPEPKAAVVGKDVGDDSDNKKKSAKSDDQYLRIKKSDKGQPQALQTAIVRYVGKKGTKYAGKVVDLVGVVHIGQREYYDILNEKLGKYDSVLYELVAPDGTRIKPEDLKKSRSVIGSMQSGMKDMLNLEYQLELIDYLAENFRHADMSPEEFAKDLECRDDSVLKMVARMMGAGLATQTGGGDAGMLFALLSSDRSMRLKQTMAKQLVDVGTMSAGMNDANGENTIIKGRNAKAFNVLEDELSGDSKRVAVFYGAGHLPDMAQRLEEDFDMTERKTQWLDAWDLTRN